MDKISNTPNNTGKRRDIDEDDSYKGDDIMARRKRKPSPCIELEMSPDEEDAILSILSDYLLFQLGIAEEIAMEMLERCKEYSERAKEKTDGSPIYIDDRSDLEKLLEYRGVRRWWYEVYYTPKDRE